jgi:outer membrane biosynthesis protein TonB
VKSAPASYDLKGLDTKLKQVASAPKPVPVAPPASNVELPEKPKPSPAPKPVKMVTPPKPKPVKKVTPPKPKLAKKIAPPKVSDPNAGPLGVALGAAPLIAIPLVALAAGREVLANTAARRAEIEKEIAEREAARAKKLINVDVDSAGVGAAFVSFNRSLSGSTVLAALITLCLPF